MSEWENLLNNNDSVESTKSEKTNQKPKKKSVESTTPAVESTSKKTPNDDEKLPTNNILDLSSLWGVLCDLRGGFGVNGLMALLTTKLENSIPKLSKSHVDFKRTPAAEAIITLFRELKRRGFQ
jgi:hypothetical protein